MPPIRMPTDGETNSTAHTGRHEAGRYMCCWCDLEGGRGLPVRRSYRVELWRIADWLKDDKMQLKVIMFTCFWSLP